MEIRRARPDEWPACAEVYVRSGRAAFDWVDPEEFQAAKFYGWAEGGEEVYLAADAGKALGVLTFRRPGNAIHNLFVEPHAQGRGIGSALLAHALRIADGPIVLKCDAANAAALGFYARRGLTQTGRGVKDNGDAYIVFGPPAHGAS